MTNDRSAVLDAQRRILSEDVRLPPSVLLEGTRGRIVREALRLFAEKGFAGTSIRDLAQACEIRSATLYAHFPAKEQVLAELVGIGHEQHHAGLAAAGGDDPVSRLRNIVTAHVLTHAEYPLLAVVANNELHALSPEEAAPALLLRADGRRLISEILNEGIAEGVFDLPDAFLAVTAISGMGMRVANWYTPDLPYTPEEIAGTYAEFALRLAGARG
ncbi:TetR/AcrR family transcriptional regulator [Nonomuraea sp. NBC_01738]|uniref:TetR/AcrR family transcriptional regulator n=1 Tax=Nonomuraea sp. NBC_01738 TaxID=2976003 RepID=UPI002E101D14|nr:TetR/AcrR family transcriptional regulator [Nonomuraea sp. NBC_01738]